MERFYSFGGVGFTLSAPGDFEEGEDLGRFSEKSAPPGFRAACAFGNAFPALSGTPALDEPYHTAWLVENGETHVCRSQRENRPWPSCTWTREGRSISMLWKPEFQSTLSAWQMLQALELFHLLLLEGGAVLHASYILVRGRAILFSGPSGVGKSTQANLWAQYRSAEVINGDRVLLRRGPDGSMWAHGICYSGTSGICRNQSAPLAAIVLLAQSKETVIQRLSGLAAFKLLLPQMAYRTWDPGDVARATQFLSELLTEKPALYLACRPDESAVKSLEKYL